MEQRAILMIEPSANLRRLNRMTLKKHIKDCVVLEAATLAEGRALIDSEKPDLIILEADMPDGSGFGFCRELRENCDIPILFLTELGTLHDITAGFDSGGSEYLTKPYSIHMLAYRADALLRRGG